MMDILMKRKDTGNLDGPTDVHRCQSDYFSKVSFKNATDATDATSTTCSTSWCNCRQFYEPWASNNATFTGETDRTDRCAYESNATTKS